jgi:hypothetical protein
MSVESELELRIAALDWTQFERLVFDLVLDENPDAVRPRPPDEGADTLVLANEGEPARVWQAKRFTGSIRWEQCEESLRTAIASYKPQSVTFVFPKDLTAAQLRSFETRLRTIGAAAGVSVDHWGVSVLRNRLQRNAHVRIRYFGYDRQTMMDVAAGRLASADPITQAMNLEEAFGADDPGFEYEVELLRGPMPEPRIVAGSSVTIMLREGPRTLRLAVRAREDDSGPVAVWSFDEGERGEAARNAAMLATARGDEEVAIESGFVVQLVNAPRLMRETFEQTPPEDRQGRFVFQPGPGIPVTITIHGAGGSSSSRQVTVYPFPPAPWPPIGEHDRAFVGLDGAFMPYFGFRLLSETHGQTLFLPQLCLGTSARENASALQFWLDLLDSERVEFSGSLFPPEITQIHPGRLAAPEEARPRFETLATVYAAVAWLEETLGVELPVHAPPISGEEIAHVGSALAILHDRTVDITFREAEGSTTRAYAEAEANRIRNRPPIVFTARETIFGTEVELGAAMGQLPDVHVIELPRLGRETVTLRVVAGDDDNVVSCRLLAPGEQPPPDAIHG